MSFRSAYADSTQNIAKYYEYFYGTGSFCTQIMHKLWNWSGDANSQSMIYTSTSFYIKPNLDEFHLFFTLHRKKIRNHEKLHALFSFAILSWCSYRNTF